MEFSNFKMFVLVGMLMLGTVSAQVVAPTVTKTVQPTEINLASCDENTETTVTLTVTGGGGTSTTVVPMDVVFALDSSGSMLGNDPTNLRMDAAKSFVDKMDDSRDQAGVVSWDDNIDFSQALTDNFTLVKEKIDAVDSSGGTNLNGGLTESISVMDAGIQTGSSRAIIFLTDGMGTYTDCASNGPAKTAADKGYVIYSIGLGSASATPLMDMATCTGGLYFTSANASNLQTIFDAIYSEIATSTIPHNVDVIEVTQSYIIDEGSFNIAPDSVVENLDGTTTITWNDIGAGDLPGDETVVLSFNAKSNQLGTDLEVDASSAHLTYEDKDSNPEGTVDIPQAYITVSDCQTCPDEDGDGIDDCTDECLDSVPDNIDLNPNNYAQNIDFGPFEVNPDNDPSLVYDMNLTRGCTCVQIVEALDKGKGHLKKGCSPSVMEEWTGINGVLDRQTYNPTKNKKGSK